MGTNRFSHANGPATLSGPYIPNQALLGSIANPPSDAGQYLFDSALGEYFVSDPSGSEWIRCSSASRKILQLTEADTPLARAEQQLVLYDTSSGAKRLILPPDAQTGDRIDMVAVGFTGQSQVGQALTFALVLDPGASVLWGQAGTQSLEQAVQTFTLTFDATGWW